MRIKQRARAMKCLIHTVALTFKSPRSIHSCLMVEKPTVAMVNNPTHLQLTTAPSAKPVRTSHVHQISVNGLRLSSLQKDTQKKMLRPVKNRSGESRRMRRDWVTRPFSNVTKMAPMIAVLVLHSRARKVR